MQKLVPVPFFLSFLLIVFSAFMLPAFSQERCATVPYMLQLRNEGKVKQTDEQFEQWLAVKRRIKQQQDQIHRLEGGPYEIPVVVHVIHNGEQVGTGSNISDAQILSQIEVLNKDFKRLNEDAVNTPSEFASLAGNLDIQFVMARRNPDGLCTTGINRVKGTKTLWSMSEDSQFKALSYWPSEDYLNIWVINFAASFIGYAQFPVSNLIGLEEYQNGLAETDGVVIDYTAFGSIDADPTFNLDPQYNKGRTTTHEIGHFFGLRHIWGDSDCGTDYVDDTPQQKNSTNNCPVNPQSTTCGSPIQKMFQNYLDYTDDACMNLFTEGQVARMELILNDNSVPRRMSLLTSSGLEFPTNLPTDVEIVSLVNPTQISCSNEQTLMVNVRNLGCGLITSMKFDYSINNGTLNSSTITNLSIDPGYSQNVEVADLNLPNGSYTLAVNVTEINNLPDEQPGNSNKTFSLNNSQTDGEIIGLVNPKFVTCNTDLELLLKVKNHSCESITALTFSYSINNSTPISSTRQGLFIPVDNEASISIGQVVLQEGQNLITISITEVNGLPDGDPANSAFTARIVADNTQDRIPLREKFDELTWPVLSPENGINWQLTPTNYGNSASIQAFNQGTVGTKAWLVTPVLDFSSTAQASVFFDLSYARNGTKNETLQILASADCGDTYPVTLFNKSGIQLAGGRISTSGWVPGSESDWDRNFIDLNFLAGYQNVRLAFVFTNAIGNNLYLDNIEFFLSDDPDPVDIENSLYSVYWSTNFEATITFNLPERMPVGIQVVDIMGRTYIDTVAPDILNQTFPIDLGQVSSGIYVLRLKINGQYYVTKFYLSR